MHLRLSWCLLPGQGRLAPAIPSGHAPSRMYSHTYLAAFCSQVSGIRVPPIPSWKHFLSFFLLNRISELHRLGSSTRGKRKSLMYCDFLPLCVLLAARHRPFKVKKLRIACELRLLSLLLCFPMPYFFWGFKKKSIQWYKIMVFLQCKRWDNYFKIICTIAFSL